MEASEIKKILNNRKKMYQEYLAEIREENRCPAGDVKKQTVTVKK
ncbi:hypothetical protein DCCM_4695 [Desulfocucumis palustris]|uniref:Uncharacterized protein n=1 Tax=Desulfocucumis palustris TaxID=1898651 RepID=A0A2L2XMK2_9FIRM|nr:hypothetical protein [Desulfocucumis palustris]GBF35566.1 hypothetical protein DCCM_4695 [Desulfocucumis palustris]